MQCWELRPFKANAAPFVLAFAPPCRKTSINRRSLLTHINSAGVAISMTERNGFLNSTRNVEWVLLSKQQNVLVGLLLSFIVLGAHQSQARELMFMFEDCGLALVAHFEFLRASFVVFAILAHTVSQHTSICRPKFPTCGTLQLTKLLAASVDCHPSNHKPRALLQGVWRQNTVRFENQVARA